MTSSGKLSWVLLFQLRCEDWPPMSTGAAGWPEAVNKAINKEQIKDPFKFACAFAKLENNTRDPAFREEGNFVYDRATVSDDIWRTFPANRSAINSAAIHPVAPAGIYPGKFRSVDDAKLFYGFIIDPSWERMMEKTGARGGRDRAAS
ncbi:hypothetical protein GWI33_003577 [Rhynchophorus ferrugineus]|uniref:Uncharacterized protein n=1 Tax=Rhynchophorus ferrugineus TaxID=354439 RepID=A0A834M2X1_RHYFE|nr:hypothetical protein GWI33_003580 [Rhynchophorus ferrugineus]KAF7263131.1 hypothetical protein GWI33_003577 [Rhynchophorus ferrugineus]